MIEGETVDLNDHGKPSASRKKPVIDTSGITFILAGAFSFLEEDKHLGTMGFGAADKAASVGDDAYDTLTEAGFSPELIGRISRVINLEPLTEEDMVDILTVKKDSVISTYTKTFDEIGIALTVTSEALQLAAHEAAEQKYGARGLSHIFNEILHDARYEALLSPGTYNECTVTAESYRDRKAVLIEDYVRDVS